MPVEFINYIYLLDVFKDINLKYSLDLSYFQIPLRELTERIDDASK